MLHTTGRVRTTGQYSLALCCWLPALAGLLLTGGPRTAEAYIGGPPATLGMMCSWSTHAIVVRVEQVSRDKGVIVWRKVRDLKGKWPAEVVRQAIGLAPDRRLILDWAEPGKTATMFALENYKWSHTYIDGCWYASNTTDWQWWNMSHVEPMLLGRYCGRAEKLAPLSTAILGSKEVIVPCMVADNAQDLVLRRAKVQRLRASLKLLNYNAKEQFVAWGGDDFDALVGMPGFSHSLSLPRVDPEVRGVCAVHIDGDGKLDLCLVGMPRLALLQNGGDSLNPHLFTLPGKAGGGRAAAWADYNGDGKPDLLLASPAGPKLFTNLGGGNFRDDSALLPQEPYYTLTACAWIDYDDDGKPDILLANGYHGLRVYRNRGQAERPAPSQPGQPPGPPQWFEDVSQKVGLGPSGIGASVKGDTLTVCDVNGDGRSDFLYGAGTGMLVLNTEAGFVQARDSGLVFQPGKVGPVFADFDNDGHPDLFVPQNGIGKLFRNDGTGHFTDVTAQAGDLARPVGRATCAAWGDFDNDGHLDLVIGCLYGPNRYFRNRGDGTFEDATEAIGLHKRIFNTRALALVDLNNDGTLDMVFNNEGQDSVALLGRPAFVGKQTPVSILINGATGVVGSRASLFDRAGKLLGARWIGSGEGCGGQGPPLARWAVPPGTYRLEVRFSSGAVRSKDITVAATPYRGSLAEKMP